MDHHVAYIAGIIDGEGTITLSREHKSAKYRTPIVSVSSTTLEILEYLKLHYGGAISTQKTYQSHHKQSWSWKVSYNGAIKLCDDVFPLLLEPTKRSRELKLIRDYGPLTMRNGKYTAEQHDAKMAFEYEFFHPSDA